MPRPLFSHVMNLRQGLLWMVSGGTLVPTDPSKILVVPGSSSTGETIRLGPRTIKERLVSFPGADSAYLTLNTALNAGAGAWVQDDASQPSWLVNLDCANDRFRVYRQPAGGSPAAILILSGTSAPVGDLTITGNNATKNTGTVWINPSDERTKDNIQPYPQGLAAINALKPSTFEFNGAAGTVKGATGIGLIAQEVEPVMPELIRHYQWTRQPKDGVAGMSGVTEDPGPEATDYLALDQTALTMALINAIKELTARVEELEKPGRPPQGP